MKILPASRPKAGFCQIVDLAEGVMGNALPEVFVVGVRGYYLDTMGAAGSNDRNLYDDALFVVSGDCFGGFNANTDPSAFKYGIASLIAGVHWYRPGNHGISRPGGGYPAFRPATPDEALPVMRDGKAGKSDGIAINIHRGGYTTTSSAGCQTIHPEQWDEFHAMLTKALTQARAKKFPYILITGPII
jgi:lysozyme